MKTKLRNIFPFSDYIDLNDWIWKLDPETRNWYFQFNDLYYFGRSPMPGFHNLTKEEIDALKAEGRSRKNEICNDLIYNSYKFTSRREVISNTDVAELLAYHRGFKHAYSPYSYTTPLAQFCEYNAWVKKYNNYKAQKKINQNKAISVYCYRQKRILGVWIDRKRCAKELGIGDATIYRGLRENKIIKGMYFSFTENQKLIRKYCPTIPIRKTNEVKCEIWDAINLRLLFVAKSITVAAKLIHVNKELARWAIRKYKAGDRYVIGDFHLKLDDGQPIKPYPYITAIKLGSGEIVGHYRNVSEVKESLGIQKDGIRKSLDRQKFVKSYILGYLHDKDLQLRIKRAQTEEALAHMKKYGNRRSGGDRK